MKKSIIPSLLLLALFSPLATSAQERVRSTGEYSMPLPQGKVELRTSGEASTGTSSAPARREDASERQASSTERRVQMQQGIAKRQAERAKKVMIATVERLEMIVARLESRMAKVEAAGGDITLSEGFVAEAKMHLGEARTSIAAFASIDLSADKASENFGRVRALAAEVKTHIRAAHQSLMKAVRSLKGIE